MQTNRAGDEVRSPLNDAPLRVSGQSLYDERDRLVNDVLLPYILFPRSFGWWRSMFAACAVILTAFAVWRIRQLWPKVRALRQGRDGERVVGQNLEELRADGARVFHDVPADGFNLDHVLVMSQGISVIETKTWSKRGRNSTISARGGRFHVCLCRGGGGACAVTL